MMPLPNCECRRPPPSVIWPRPKPGKSILPSQPSNPSELMYVGKYSAQPLFEATLLVADGVAPAAPVKPGVPEKLCKKVAVGEFCNDSGGPACEGRILFTVQH